MGSLIITASDQSVETLLRNVFGSAPAAAGRSGAASLRNDRISAPNGNHPGTSE
ncbi:MAG TPA: hypothetical protein VH088_23025 [Terriglobales bacterium]|nr:hypothetical protein [Terriglobales bacterium]